MNINRLRFSVILLLGFWNVGNALADLQQQPIQHTLSPMYVAQINSDLKIRSRAATGLGKCWDEFLGCSGTDVGKSTNKKCFGGEQLQLGLGNRPEPMLQQFWKDIEMQEAEKNGPQFTETPSSQPLKVG